MNGDAGLERLKKTRYPGRGIVIGQTLDAKHFVQVYWIMGRSATSRNRVFVSDGDFVKTDTVDKSQQVDPLTLYYPVKVWQTAHLVSNGDQTDTMYQALETGGSFESALMGRTFEPDGPNFTPRISGIVNLSCQKHAYQLAILKTVGGDERYSCRQFFNFETAIPGVGHCVTTYQVPAYAGMGNPLPSFEGEPFLVALRGDLNEVAHTFWHLLDAENRVSMLAKFIEKASGRSTLLIVNKFGS